MVKKKRIGLQIRFNPESERDLVAYFSTLKKSEVHITVVSAFRMYMRSVGFYDQRWLENFSLADRIKKLETCASSKPRSKAEFEQEGLLDEETFRTFDAMFDSENG